MNRNVVRLMLAGVLLGSSSLMADTGDARVWLQKMGRAITDQNYAGIFTFMRGSTFETIRIVHTNEDGIETERLFNMNGEIRELYRHGNEILCYHPMAGKEETPELSEHAVQIGPFTAAFSERVLASQNLYNLSMLGEDRIAGREAIILSVSPRADDRYGYRVWVDRETGLMLQSHLVERGRIREIFQFTSLEIGMPLDESMLVSNIRGETVSHKLSLEMADHTDKPDWRVAWLPDGFRPIRTVGNRLHFSDGVANFSVFVENAGASSLPDMTTTIGGTVVITRRIKNQGPQITVVGEVPVPTARRVAESVERAIY